MKVGKYLVRRLDQYNIGVFEPKLNKHKEVAEGAALSFHRGWEGAMLKLLRLKVESSETKAVLKEIRSAKKEIVAAVKEQGLS